MRPLTESYWPARDDIPLIETTSGDALRAAAAARPDHVALIEGHPDPARRRRWTYAELLHDAEATARDGAGSRDTSSRSLSRQAGSSSSA